MSEAGCRLFVAPDRLRAGALIVDGADHHYLTRVRRMTIGDELVLFDGARRQAAATIAAIDAETATLDVGEPVSVTRPPRPELVVLVALVKGQRMEWCLQKLVELGVDRVVPFAAARSVVRLDAARAAKRHKRLQAIAVDAARQCERDELPEVAPIASFAEALAAGGVAGRRIMLLERETRPLAAVLDAGAAESVCLLVGPEGGFEPSEVDEARAAGFETVGLGPRVLRAETAAVAAAAIVGFALGDIGSAAP